MELLYLWIESYNNIVDSEFLFTSEYNIELNRNLRKLTISKRDISKINLYNNAFVNITAIIGKNGSGKTSLLSFLQVIFLNRYSDFYKFILVVKKQDNSILIIDKYSNDSETLYDSVEENTLVINIEKRVEPIFEQVMLLVHSNSFSAYEARAQSSNIIDISFNSQLALQTIESNKLLLDLYEKHINNSESPLGSEEKDDIKTKYSKIVSSVFNLKHSNIKENVNFISSHRDQGWDFIPKYIELSFNYNFYIKNKAFFESKGLRTKLELIESVIYKKEKNPSNQEHIINNFINRLLLSLFLYYLALAENYFPVNSIGKQVIEDIEREVDISNIIDIVKSSISNCPSTYDDHPLSKLKAIFQNLESQMIGVIDLNPGIPHIYTFRTTDQICSALKLIFDFCKYDEFILIFNWHSLSAGESALLNLFSRIKAMSDYYIHGDTIWIIIDEGDLYLHPEWQRTYLYNLHKYMPKFFERKKIQLFLTSHSPFLASDLLRENIILLEKGDYGRCIVRKNEQNETFGANIHSLLAHGFFMNVTIGEFAREKINEIIKYTKSEASIITSEMDAQKLIDIIGEPVIKNKLQNLLNIKRGKQATIEWHRDQIAKLEGGSI